MVKEVKCSNPDTFKGKCKRAWEKTKAVTKKAVTNTVEWCSENKELAVGLVTVAVPTIAKTTKAIHGYSVKRREEREVRMRVWDPVTGMYWYLRRPMTMEQQREYERRWRAGETRGDILRSMRLI